MIRILLLWWLRGAWLIGLILGAALGALLLGLARLAWVAPPLGPEELSCRY